MGTEGTLDNGGIKCQAKAVDLGTYALQLAEMGRELNFLMNRGAQRSEGVGQVHIRRDSGRACGW